MEWIRIGSHKLKITLSAEDARHYALNCERSDYTDAVTSGAFREILTDMQKETGFEAGDDRIYIQMYPSKAGGCELFVTRMGLSCAEEPKAVSEAEPCTVALPTAGKKEAAFRFSELPDLLLLCRHIADSYTGDSEIWQDERGGWWLLLTKWGSRKSTREEFRPMGEYGHPENADRARLLLSEHGRLICKSNAVRTFSEF